jgi:hypothetical protein
MHSSHAPGGARVPLGACRTLIEAPGAMCVFVRVCVYAAADIAKAPLLDVAVGKYVYMYLYACLYTYIFVCVCV